MDKSKDKYYIGLDIGTASVGWAATDTQYKPLRIKGENALGVRLFDEAKTAEERRIRRAQKVRMKRSRQRLKWLRTLLEDEISSKDPKFFARLESSSYWRNEKQLHGLPTLDSLFADSSFSDKEYFKLFKNTYYLRSYLMDEKSWRGSPPDIRLVYLSIAHILKNRGHFLYEFETNESNGADTQQWGYELFNALNLYLSNEQSEDDRDPIAFDISNFEELLNIIMDNKMNRTVKSVELGKLLLAKNKIENIKHGQKMVDTLVGRKVAIKDIIEGYEEGEMTHVEFAKKWEDEAPRLKAALGDDYNLVELLKNIYDWFVLIRVLQGKSSISTSMVEKDKLHKQQLLFLKQLVKEKSLHKYETIFRCNNTQNNYASWIGTNLRRGKKYVATKNAPGGRKEFFKSATSYDDFIKFLKKELGDIYNLPEAENMRNEIDNKNFLVKLRTTDNSTIPYQLHKRELDIILANAEKYDIFSADICEKIKSIMTFRVPYYVGRLNTYKGDNEKRHVWASRTPKGEKLTVDINGKSYRESITPWNFDEMIDHHSSNKAFMERMIKTCTYIDGARVLPRYSMLYSKFAVLNELNGLRINGDRVSVKTKQDIYNELFKKHKRVSIKLLIDFLKADKNYGYENIKKENISGIDIHGNGFNNNLASYIELYKIFGEDIETRETMNIVERIIELHALNENKKMVRELIVREYDYLSPIIQQALGRLTFNGFGNLSADFLDDVDIPIIRIMWENNLNLMEILHSREFGVREWLDDLNGLEKNKTDDEILSKSYASPSIKRAVNQAIQVVSEISELTGKPPGKIFIEVTRSNTQEKKRTISRKNRLMDLYKGISRTNQEILKELDGIDEKQLKGKHVYLYFLQCGRCAYSGDPINISDILAGKTSLYNIDHIIPQAYKKDDSISNLVLSKQNINARKSSTYPLSLIEEINSNRSKLVNMWEGWHKNGFMSTEKLANLKRVTPLSESEKYEFIARQLVSTAQSTTIVAKILKQRFPDTEVLYSKAENVSDFRNKFEILKCRDVNDHHHAHDAYLNVVVGNVYHTKFNKSFWKKGVDDQRLSANRVFDLDVDGVWIAPNNQNRTGTIEMVDKAIGIKSILVTKKLHSGDGEFYNQTIYPAHARQKEIDDGRKAVDILEKESLLIKRKGDFNPLSKSSQYGGFKKENTAYFMIIEFDDKKGNRMKRFEQISTMNKKHWQTLTKAEQELELSKDYPNTKIIDDKILINSLFEIGPMRIRITGCNESNIYFHNYNQWLPEDKFRKHIRIVSEYITKISKKVLNPQDYNGKEEFVLASKNKHKKVRKVENLELFDEICDALNRMYGAYPMLKGKSLGLPDMYDKLIAAREKFIRLNITEQLAMLDCLIKGMGCNAINFDLSAVGGGKDVGKIQPSRSIGALPLTIVRESVTGLKTKRIVIIPKSEVHI
ncbi:MAG: type II CRISPR RNA-guided endonuclease Cas9 [Firmicutes bacterium]|nr:type II CRISPR RNA-guided endonuclease Cas9 [Bacillota bacterium]